MSSWEQTLGRLCCSPYSQGSPLCLPDLPKHFSAISKDTSGLRFWFKDRTARNWVKSARWKRKGRRAQVLRLLQVCTGDKSPAHGHTCPQGPSLDSWCSIPSDCSGGFRHSLSLITKRNSGEKLNPVSSDTTSPGRKTPELTHLSLPVLRVQQHSQDTKPSQRDKPAPRPRTRRTVFRTG